MRRRVRTHGFASIEDRHGRWWRNLRAHRWFNLSRESDDGKGYPLGSVSIGGQWVHGADFPGGLRLKVSTTGEEFLDVAYGLGRLVRHYWSLDIDPAEGKRPRLPRLRFDVELRLTGASWCFGPDPQSWERDASWRERLRRNDLRWFRGGWHVREREEVATVETVVPLPEGNVPATVTLERVVLGWRVGPYKLTRRAPRWSWLRFWLPFLRRVNWSTDLKCEAGLPVPGKGENSWDCGPDAIYGQHAPAKGPMPVDAEVAASDRGEWVGYAIADVVGAVFRARQRYGGGITDTGRPTPEPEPIEWRGNGPSV